MSHAQLRALLESAYGSAPAESELAWWFGGPVAAHLQLDDGRGADGVKLFRIGVDGEELLASFIVHAVTAPSARGQGVFSQLQRANEEWAREQGAALALGFTTRTATKVLVGRLGWTLLGRPRVWARLRLRRGRSLAGDEIRGFEQRHERLDARGPLHLLKDAAWLDWRYRDSPRPYRLVEAESGYAVVGIGRHGGIVAGAVCELAGGRRVLGRGVRAARAPLVLALPSRGQRALFASAGFVPTPWRLNVVGRSLDPNVSLPREWRLTLGDTDFF